MSFLGKVSAKEAKRRRTYKYCWWNRPLFVAHGGLILGIVDLWIYKDKFLQWANFCTPVKKPPFFVGVFPICGAWTMANLSWPHRPGHVDAPPFVFGPLRGWRVAKAPAGEGQALLAGAGGWRHHRFSLSSIERHLGWFSWGQKMAESGWGERSGGKILQSFFWVLK